MTSNRQFSQQCRYWGSLTSTPIPASWLFNHRAIVLTTAFSRAGFVGFGDFEFLDAYVTQHIFEISTRGEDDFAVAQRFSIHILLILLAFTAESRTEGPEITQLHRQMIFQIPHDSIDQTVSHHLFRNFFYFSRTYVHFCTVNRK